MNLNISALPSILLSDKDNLPECAAIYFVTGIGDELLYIGKTRNLKKRWRSHHRLKQFLEMEKLSISWLEADSLSNLRSLENEFINGLNPEFNYKPLGDYAYSSFQVGALKVGQIELEKKVIANLKVMAALDGIPLKRLIAHIIVEHIRPSSPVDWEDEQIRLDDDSDNVYDEEAQE